MTIIIALLISLGFIGNAEEFHNLNTTEQQELIDIVIIEDLDM